MATEKLTIRVEYAWWVRWYVDACIAFGLLHRLQPDGERIASFIVRHGMRFHIEKEQHHGG